MHEHRTTIGGYAVSGGDCSGTVAVEQDYWGVSTSWAVGDKIGATSTALGAVALLSVLSFF